MKILAIDTSCDETSAAITNNIQAGSNIIWSSASQHLSFGGVVPSVAMRAHQERIGFVVKKALKTANTTIPNCDAIAVTVGPGLSIALGVGIDYAKKLAKKYNKPLIPINHIEAHLLAPLVIPRSKTAKDKLVFPAYGLILSGGTTLLCLAKNIGEYEILAQTNDDALGEALDKAARLLGFGYPGATILEKFAKEGDPEKYKLPVPLINDRIKNRFSYSGLKTAFIRLYESIKNPTKQDVCDLAATFQNTAFTHVTNVLEYQISTYHLSLKPYHLLFGGGVSNNIELRKRLRKVCKKHGITLHVPYSKKLTGDNAAMIGVCAYLKLTTDNLPLTTFFDYPSIDRNPKLSL